MSEALKLTRFQWLALPDRTSVYPEDATLDELYRQGDDTKHVFRVRSNRKGWDAFSCELVVQTRFGLLPEWSPMSLPEVNGLLAARELIHRTTTTGQADARTVGHLMGMLPWLVERLMMAEHTCQELKLVKESVEFSDALAVATAASKGTLN